MERQILKAEAEGKLKGLEGEGKPLPDHPEEAMTDPATAAGHRIMAAAGVVPEEITLKKALDAARKAYAAIPEADSAARKSEMRQIADLELRHNIAQDARKKFMS